MSSTAVRSLSDWLRSRSDEWLVALLRVRPDLAVPVPADMGVLATRVGVRASVGRALEDLDAFALQVLDGLLLAGSPASYAELRALLGSGVPDDGLRVTVDRLRELAIVWGQDEALHVLGSVRELMSPYPAGLGRPMAEVATVLRGARLSATLQTLGLPPVDQPRAADRIADRFADPAWLQALLRRCGQEERTVLAQLDAGPPLGQLPDAERVVSADEATTPVGWLLAHALLVGVEPEMVELPREVGLALRGDRPLGVSRLRPPPMPTQDVGRSTVDKTAAGQVLNVLRHVEQLVESLGTASPAVLRGGGLGVRDLRRMARSHELTEAETALYLEIGLSAGLLDSSGHTNPSWLPTRAFDVWRADSPAGRWVQLATGWLELRRWPALVGRRDERDKPINVLSAEVARAWAVSTRRRTLDVLADLPAGSAAPPDAVLEHLRWRTPRRAAVTRAEHVQAVMAEAELLGILARAAISGPGRAVRSGTGDAAGLVAGLLPEPVDHLLVQADLTVVAPGPLEPELATEISLVADVESSGGATVYRVIESSVRRALDAGRTAADLHALFAARSRTPVPQALTYLIDDAARRHGRLRAGTATSYLRCDDESLLAQVLVDRRTTALRLRRLAPTVLISSSSVATLLEELRAVGYAPAAEDPQGAVVLTRAESRRLPARRRTGPANQRRPSDEQLGEVVRQLRAGDQAARNARRMPVSTRVPGVTTMGTLELLQQAAREHRQVWLGYVDAEGGASHRIVDVVSVSGGFLQAFDHTTGAARTFPLHRVTSAALLGPAP